MNLFGRWRKKNKGAEDKIKKVVYTEELSNEPKEYEDVGMLTKRAREYIENYESLKEAKEKVKQFERLAELEKFILKKEWCNANWSDANDLWGDEVKERKKPLHEKVGVQPSAIDAVKNFLSDPSNQMLLNNNSWYELIIAWCDYVKKGNYEYLPVYGEDLVKVLEASGLEIDYDEVVRAYKDCGR